MIQFKLHKAIVIALVLTMAASFAMAQATARKGAEPGAIKLVEKGAEPILFDLKNLNGDDIKLGDYVGKKSVMLIFWSLFCGPCQEELPLIDKLGKKYKEEGFEVFSINLDGDKRGKAVKKYMKKKGYTFEVLWEKIDGISYVTADAYGVQGTPTTVIVGKGGKVSYVHVGLETEEEMEKVVLETLAE
jgi:thiol-disulfide isomerase/thioredoxin